MILGSITSYIGQDSSAIHYYCQYKIVDDKTVLRTEFSTNDNDLNRTIKYESEVATLNKKDGWRGWHVGSETNRFNSIQQIHTELKKQFKGQIIVTYYDGKIFKKMLYFKNGKNIGYKSFGETWTLTPTSVYKHLLPPSNQIKIKCDNCGTEYKFEDVTYEREWMDGKTLVEFIKKRDLEAEDVNICCKYFDLIWNVVI